jgi:cation transport regulator ChaC
LDDIEQVKAHLDYREQDGYSVERVDVFSSDDDDASQEPLISNAITYIATTRNPSFLGPASTADLARHIYASRGPSGLNAEYALALSRALRQLIPGRNACDLHTFTLERHLLELISMDFKHNSSEHSEYQSDLARFLSDSYKN